MDTTQQTIGKIVGDFTELAHDLHDQGLINEGKLKELLDLGMALAKPNMTAYGRRSGPELIEENAALRADLAGSCARLTTLLRVSRHLKKEYLGLVEDSSALMKDFKFRGRMINSLLFVAEQQNAQITDLGGEPVEAPGELVAKVNARWRRFRASRGRRLMGVWANRLRD